MAPLTATALTLVPGQSARALPPPFERTLHQVRRARAEVSSLLSRSDDPDGNIAQALDAMRLAVRWLAIHEARRMARAGGAS